ncbi:Neurobeachin [Chelonia mydas]|uniref:Neurobeachin n=1 Tax=Chelonia mydas TaxID=8469 RepID=M7BAQ4_CHEMY|nr:Neurobeachin [Chelonia mydas]
MLVASGSHLSQLHDFWRLDYWEDDLRRRRRFVRNAFGSTHSDALLKAAVEYGTEEDVVKSKKTFRSQTVVNQNAETELMLEGDDDAVSLLQEKEIDNLAGPATSVLLQGRHTLKPGIGNLWHAAHAASRSPDWPGTANFCQWEPRLVEPVDAAGPVVLSTPAQLIAPVVVAKGTLSITTTEIYFEVDEDDPAFKKIDPKLVIK